MVRSRPGRSATERASALALQLMPVAVLVGWLVAAAADVDDATGPIELSTQTVNRTDVPSGEQSSGSVPDGGDDASGAPTPAAPAGAPRRPESGGGDVAFPTEAPRAADVRPWFSEPFFDVVIPEPGVRLPRFDVSLPTVELLVGGAGDDPRRASAPVPAATGGSPGPGPAPTVLLLASLGCLAVATGRRLRAMRRRAGRAPPEAAAETDQLSQPSERGADLASSPPEPVADLVPAPEELEVVDVPARPARPARPAAPPHPSRPQPTSPHPWDRPPRPIADADPDVGECSPGPWVDRLGSARPTVSEADGRQVTAAADRAPEPCDTLTVRPPTGAVVHTASTPDDPVQASGQGPVTGPAPLVVGPIIRPPKHGRIRR